jgi:hypothetical protein
MEKIPELLSKITANIPAKVQKKLNALEELKKKLALAKKEHEELPTADSEEQLQNVTDYVQDETDELIEDLESILLQQEEKSQNNPAPVVIAEPVVKVVEPVVITEPVITPTEEVKPKEKGDGIGWFPLIGGLALLVISAGVINTLRK